MKKLDNTTTNESLSGLNMPGNICRLPNSSINNRTNNEKNRIYALVKEPRKIHLISLDRFNIVIEIQDVKKILIYSNEDIYLITFYYTLKSLFIFHQVKRLIQILNLEI